MKKVLAIPDIHAPFHSMDAIAKAYQIIKQEKPDVVVQLGDFAEFLCYSKHPHSFDLMTPEQEVEESHQFMQAFWENVKKASPKVRCIQLTGNHGGRLKKRILEVLPAAFGNVDIDKVFTFPGVECLHSNRDMVEIDGVLYLHGCFTRSGEHMRFFEQSVVRGHSHKASVTYLARRSKTMFELECGWLGDETAIPFNYLRTAVTGWVKSVGIVDNYGPRLVLL